MAKASKGQTKRSGGRPGAGAPAASRFALTRRQRRRLGWAAVAAAALVVVGMGGWLYARARGPAPGDFVPSLGNEHIPTAETPHVPYNSDPPTSGPHLPYIAPWGVHTAADRQGAPGAQPGGRRRRGERTSPSARTRSWPGSARSSSATRITCSWPRTRASTAASR